MANFFNEIFSGVTVNFLQCFWGWQCGSHFVNLWKAVFVKLPKVRFALLIFFLGDQRIEAEVFENCLFFFLFFLFVLFGNNFDWLANSDAFQLNYIIYTNYTRGIAPMYYCGRYTFRSIDALIKLRVVMSEFQILHEFFSCCWSYASLIWILYFCTPSFRGCHLFFTKRFVFNYTCSVTWGALLTWKIRSLCEMFTFSLNVVDQKAGLVISQQKNLWSLILFLAEYSIVISERQCIGIFETICLTTFWKRLVSDLE